MCKANDSCWVKYVNVTICKTGNDLEIVRFDPIVVLSGRSSLLAGLEVLVNNKLCKLS